MYFQKKTVLGGLDLMSPNNMECVLTSSHILIHFHESDEWTEHRYSFWLPDVNIEKCLWLQYMV